MTRKILLLRVFGMTRIVFGPCSSVRKETHCKLTPQVDSASPLHFLLSISQLSPFVCPIFCRWLLHFSLGKGWMSSKINTIIQQRHEDIIRHSSNDSSKWPRLCVLLPLHSAATIPRGWIKTGQISPRWDVTLTDEDTCFNFKCELRFQIAFNKKIE